MKRSKINAVMRDADAFIKRRGFYLPPFAYWTAETWAAQREGAREIIDQQLGWDITDFGTDRYDEVGLFLFTLRSNKLYAEKLLIVAVEQVTPLHFHRVKTEDLINRGGGDLAIQLYNATAEGGLAETDVVVSVDGLKRTVKAGGVVTLSPGQSITLLPYCYHQFWGTKNPVLVGEISTANDDHSDNRFYEAIGRFADIEEDESPLYLLVNDH